MSKIFKLSKAKTFLALLMMIALLFSLCLNVSAATDVVFDNCDSTSGWNGGVKRDNEVMTEGEGSIRFTVKPTTESFVVYKVLSAPIDVTGANCIEFDIWLDDVSMIENNTYFALETTSSGTWDQDEIEWSDDLRYADYSEGWSHIALNLKDSTIDLSKVNFFRIFMLGISVDTEMNVRLDNIRFSYREDLETAAPETVVIPETIPSETAAPETVAIPETAPSETAAPETVAIPGTMADLAASGSPAAPSASSWLSVMIIAAVAAGVIGAFLLVFGIVKKNRVMPALGIIMIACGVVVLVLGLTQSGKTETSAVEETTASDTVSEPEYDPNDITTIYFKDTIDSTLPTVTLGETLIENGLTAVNGNGDPFTMQITDKSCWILEYDRKSEDKNFMYIDADEATKSAYNGRDIAIGFIYYITEPANVIISYTKSDGSVAEVTKSAVKANSKWTKLNINLPDCSLSGGVDGHDIKIRTRAAELFRINMIYLREPVAAVAAEGSQLVIPKYECGEYIVADYNIMNFGAVGDGKTDDTDAIKTAIEYVSSHGGGTIFMPEGKYCLTDTLSLPTSVSLVGELETGTAKGTVLYAYCGKGSAIGEALITMSHGSSLRNMAIYYPEQRFVNGAPIPYPYTIEQVGTEGLDIENITFVNSYNGIDFSEGGDSLQTVRNINGTILNTGYQMNACWDIGRLEHVYFSPKFWLECGLESIPVREELENYMLTHSVGLIIERIDWTYFSDVRIEGYNIGMLARASSDGAVNGHMYNFELVDCFNPLVIRDVSGIGIIITNCKFSAVGGKGAVAVYCESSFDSDLCFNSCEIKSEGDNAIVNNGSGTITVVDSTVSSTDTAYVNARGNSTFINTEVAGEDVITADTVKLDTSYDYDRYVYTKPASDKFVDMSLEPYSIRSGADITEKLQAAIDSLKDTGGMVYIPSGTYYVEAAITVHAGIELRGPMDSPHFGGSATAVINTDFGRNDPDGDALFTMMDGSGIRGINFFYYNQKTANITPYSFTIRGNGSDIYLCNLFMPSSYNGVDFATYRCDRHYVEYIWGTPIYRGVVVGAGSEDGIIRDIQYTPNSWNAEGVDWGEAHSFIMTYSEPFVIGDSKREIVYHNFTYGAWRGLTLTDGARDTFVIAHGVDSGNFSAYFEGDCTAQLVNAQLVNLNGKEMNYVYTSENFTGNVSMLNTNMWGTTKGAIVKQGEGTLFMLGGEVLESGARMLTVTGGDMTIAGIHNRQKNLRNDIMADDGIKSLTAYGNIFTSGGKFNVTEVSPEKLHGAIFE